MAKKSKQIDFLTSEVNVSQALLKPDLSKSSFQIILNAKCYSGEGNQLH